MKWTLRRKFLMALVGLVCIMAIVFAGIALTSVNFLLGHAVSYVQEGFKQQWNRTLTGYYMEHQSWNGVQEQITKMLANPNSSRSETEVAAPRGNERYYVFDANQMVVASSRPEDLGKNLGQIPYDNQLAKDWTEMTINGKTVGYFWLDDKAPPRQNRLAQTIGESIFRSMWIGLILTTLLAVILGSILTNRLTGPLKELTSAVRRVGKGELGTHLEVNGHDDISMLGQAFNQMTEQLVHNEEVRRNMVADIAHELRTPLAIISGKLESIQEGVLPLGPETLLPIQDETIRLSRLVQDLQQLSLAEAGKLPLHPMPMNISNLLGRIFEQFAFEFEERGIQGELSSESWNINADSDRLTQVFVNLIGNALIHTSIGGKIKVSVDSWEPKASSSEDEKKVGGRISRLATGENSLEYLEKTKANQIEQTEWIRVTVEDTGEGIPPEDLDHIFDRFYRVDQSRDRETGGTGLGLAIANGYVQAHGGEIRVESELGKGTRFYVFLPMNFNNL